MTLDLTFTLPQMLSLIGMCQAAFILTFIGGRAQNFASAALPLTYFLCLGLAFFLDFAAPYWAGLDNLSLLQWTAWLVGPPLSVPVVLQIVRSGKMPPWFAYLAAIIILAMGTFCYLAHIRAIGCSAWQECDTVRNWLVLSDVIVGLLAYAAVAPYWSDIRRCKREGGERYWLVVTLIAVNLWLLSMILIWGFNPGLAAKLLIMRSIIGVTLIYVATTSLLRIYPQAIELKSPASKNDLLTPNEEKSVEQLRDLIERQKIYQEPDCSRSFVARELAVSENAVSRIVSKVYGRTFPQLINEKRVDDAKQLLKETSAPAKIVASDVGFASLASFNRVFRDISGQSPSEYRTSSRK